MGAENEVHMESLIKCALCLVLLSDYRWLFSGSLQLLSCSTYSPLFFSELKIFTVFKAGLY